MDVWLFPWHKQLYVSGTLNTNPNPNPIFLNKSEERVSPLALQSTGE